MTRHELFPASCELSDDSPIRIGGVDLHRLVEEFGTPLYIYDAATISGNYSRLRVLLDHYYPETSRIAYASKAYLSLKFARKLVTLGASIDVVSRGEFEIALKAGFSPDRIHLHGNNKSNSEIDMAIQHEIEAIVVDSLDELHYLDSICNTSTKKPRVWLRINPSINVQTHRAVQTGHGVSKFGIPIENRLAGQAITEALGSNNIELVGIHVHLGSQIFEPHPYAEAIRAVMQLCRDIGWNPPVVSPGGGWGVPYTQEFPDGNVADWIRTISTVLVDWCARMKVPLPALVIEPGRWLVARAGVSIYRVGTCKQSIDEDWIATVDGGMADNPRPALYGSPYTAVLLDDKTNRPVVPTRLVGRFCESGDELIHQINLPRLDRNDIIAIPVSGAYQLSMASNYNLADRPCVLWVEDGRVEILQHRERASESAWWLGD